MLNQQINTTGLNLRDKKIVYSGLLIVASAGWLYMFYMAWAMQNMHLVDMWMPPVGSARTWTGYDFFMLFMMWFTMMIAMMTPTVVPMVMMFTNVNKSKKRKQQPYAPTWLFLLGYLFSWGFFSLVVSVIQWPLHGIGLLDPMMDSRSYLLSGGILILAGLYQFTALKDVCLDQCRTPLGFVMTAWRDGHVGALKMGFHHGFFCIGCCWALMLILFAVGVMNMLWVILITIFVLLEKVLPISPDLMRKITGMALVVWGGYWLALYPW
jgi:predicted metal-binding membrane protein